MKLVSKNQESLGYPVVTRVWPYDHWSLHDIGLWQTDRWTDGRHRPYPSHALAQLNATNHQQSRKLFAKGTHSDSGRLRFIEAIDRLLRFRLYSAKSRKRMWGAAAGRPFHALGPANVRLPKVACDIQFVTNWQIVCQDDVSRLNVGHFLWKFSHGHIPLPRTISAGQFPSQVGHSPVKLWMLALGYDILCIHTIQR